MITKVKCNVTCITITLLCVIHLDILRPSVHLESCFVRSDSPMDLTSEMFLFDGDLLRELDLQVDLNNRGLFVGQVEGRVAYHVGIITINE